MLEDGRGLDEGRWMFAPPRLGRVGGKLKQLVEVLHSLATKSATSMGQLPAENSAGRSRPIAQGGDGGGVVDGAAPHSDIGASQSTDEDDNTRRRRP